MPSPTSIRFTSVEFHNFKAFRHFSVALDHMNILVGPNNSGKSTVISAFRILETALRRARARNPVRLSNLSDEPLGYALSEESLPISMENAAHDYQDVEAQISFRLSNSNRLTLRFPSGRQMYLVADTTKGRPQTTVDFKKAFPISLMTVLPLGPLEYNEVRVELKTVQDCLSTHRASRHFRNYWFYIPDGFESFAKMVAQTWPGMEVERPELVPDGPPTTIAMFCKERRVSRELCWAGVGFQVWCQLLTHISRANDATLVVLDEPEIYLHPDVQRQLLGLLRKLGSDVLLATHSTEIMGEADPDDIMIVEKSHKSAHRVRDVDGVQAALDTVGSVQNITLTQLARNRRVLFTEGSDDFKIIRHFARILGLDQLAAGMSITSVESEGFASWERIRDFAWGLQKTIGGDNTLRIAAVFDHDYFCEEQVRHLISELNQHIAFSQVLSRKEIENYLLVPGVLQRAADRSIADRERRTDGERSASIDIVKVLIEITDSMQSRIQAQYIARRWDWFRTLGRDNADVSRETIESFNLRWQNLETRLEIVPGKEVLGAVREVVKSQTGASLTLGRIMQAFREGDVPNDMVVLVNGIDQFRK